MSKTIKTITLVVSLIVALSTGFYKAYDIGYDMGQTAALLSVKSDIDKLEKQLKKYKKESKYGK